MCLPSTSSRSAPTISGVITPGSNVAAFSMTPAAWMPDSWANAFSPTIGALAGWSTLLRASTVRARPVIAVVSIPVSAP